MNKEIETLKKFLSYSSEHVSIIGYDGEILWSNKPDPFNFSVSEAFGKFLKLHGNSVKSGNYILNSNKTELMANVTDYCDMEVYVVQISNEDIFFKMIKSEPVKSYISEQMAKTRHFIAGITASGTVLRSTLDEAGITENFKYFEIAEGNCYKIMKSVIGISELIKYADKAYELQRVNLGAVLTEFAASCRNVLKNQIEIQFRAEPELYISADSEQLVQCLLSLAVLAGKNNPKCSEIMFTAERMGDSVSLTISSDGEREVKVSNMFSTFERDNSDSFIDIDLFIVKQFCNACNGMFFAADSNKNNGGFYSLKFPICNDKDRKIVLCTSANSYHTEKFSIYRIMLSEIADTFA